MEPEISLLSSQESPNGLYPEPHESRPPSLSLSPLKILSNNIFLFSLRCPNWYLTFGFPITFLRTSDLSHATYVPLPSHPPWVDHPNIWWRVQIMKLLLLLSLS